MPAGTIAATAKRPPKNMPRNGHGNLSEETCVLQPVRFLRYERHGLFMALQWYQLTLAALDTLVAVIASTVGGPVAFFLTAPIWLGNMVFSVLHFGRIPEPAWAYTVSMFFLRSVLNEPRCL